MEFTDTVTVGDSYEDDHAVFYAVFEGEYTEPEPEPDPQDPTFTPPQPITGLVYDCTEQELITPGSATNGTMLYSLSETEGYSEDIPVGTDAGEYIVWYRVKGDEGYNDVDPQPPLTVIIAKADPVPPKTDLNAIVGQTLEDVEPQLPEGYSWLDNTLDVGGVGENHFPATFTPKDTKNFNTLQVMLTVKVTKPQTKPEPKPEPEPQDPKITPPVAREGLVYDCTEQELIIPGSAEGGTMVYKLGEEREIALLSDDDGYSEDIPLGINAGEYTVWYMVIGDEGYNDTEPKALTVFIARADPVPPETDLNAIVGQTLKDVEPQLPEGYAWADRTQSVGGVGENRFPATFTPKDTRNFNTVSLMLTVRVKKPAPAPPDAEVDEDRVPHTGVALAVIPLIAAAAAAFVFRKHK